MVTAIPLRSIIQLRDSDVEVRITTEDRDLSFTLKRRCSSRTFRYGYLVTT